MHTTTGRWKRGFALALLTAVCWGVLPVALEIALQRLDPYTFTWYRFAVSGLVLGIILMATRGLPSPRLSRHVWVLLAVAVCGLAGNYALYLASLVHTTPTVAQIVMQSGPMFFLLGGVLLYKERFSTGQSLGLGLLVLGFALFFNRRLPQLADLSSSTGLGVALALLSSFSWALYGLAQKQLLTSFQPQQILLLVYVGAAILLSPMVSPRAIVHLSELQLWMVAFSCANTLIAYGAFVEALKHWEASRVGATLSLSPLFALISVYLMDRFAPGFLEPEGLNALGVLGALLVVGGSAACALTARGETASV